MESRIKPWFGAEFAIDVCDGFICEIDLRRRMRRPIFFPSSHRAGHIENPSVDSKTKVPETDTVDFEPGY